MTYRLLFRIMALLLIILLSAAARAQQKDVTFFVIGKHANFDQSATGALAPVDFSFFAEIFLTGNGDAQNAFMNMPTGERIRFRDQRTVDGPDRDNLLLISGAKRFPSYAELLSWYPDGVYEIEFDTPKTAYRTRRRLCCTREANQSAPRLTRARRWKCAGVSFHRAGRMKMEFSTI